MTNGNGLAMFRAGLGSLWGIELGSDRMFRFEVSRVEVLVLFESTEEVERLSMVARKKGCGRCGKLGFDGGGRAEKAPKTRCNTAQLE